MYLLYKQKQKTQIKLLYKLKKFDDYLFNWCNISLYYVTLKENNMQQYPDHYSHKFKFDISKLPARGVDRFSRLILSVAALCGAFLCLIGVYQIFHFSLDGVADLESNLPQTHIKIHTFVPPVIFNSLLIILGAGLILNSFIRLLRYKIIFFDGDVFTVKNHPFFGKSYKFSERLYNYSGVRLRVKFYQYGIFNKNKFIIEMYHKDPAKIIPLYISTDKHHIRKLWKEYAQILRMPALTISERGMVSHNFNDLNRSYPEVVAKWHLPKDFAYRQEKPSYISFKSRKSGEKMIKIRKLFFDAYSFLSMFAIAAFGSLLAYAGLNHDILIQHLPYNAVIIFYAFLLAIIIYAFLSLITKDIIVLSKDRIYIFRKIGFLRIRDGVIKFSELKGIDINFTPTSDSYFLAIVSDKGTTVFGNKLPVEGLRWIRGVLVNEINSEQ